MKVLHLLMTINFFALDWVHSNLRVTFLVVFAFFLNTGLVCPPKPFCLASYLLFPADEREALTLDDERILSFFVLRNLMESMFLEFLAVGHHCLWEVNLNV